MAYKKKREKSARTKILDAAWELFLKQGYPQTTINEIIEVSGTSRGAFYHHFHGKEELLFSLAFHFDKSYQGWLETIPPGTPPDQKLLLFNSYVMKGLEHSQFLSLLPSLYGMQVMTSGIRPIINPNRDYYRIVLTIIQEGLDSGCFQSSLSANELAEWYTILERGLTYDWLLKQQQYSLSQYGKRIILNFLKEITSSS